MNLKAAIIFILCIRLSACANLEQVMKDLEQTTKTESIIPSTEEMAMGLKEALAKGTEIGVSQLHQENGFMNDPKVKIPFPKDLEKVKNTLIDIGLESQVDKVVLSLNRAAEDAVVEAKPIFLNAIKEMTFNDAKNILFGNDTAATNFLIRKTSTSLEAAFQPKIQSSLDKVNATKYWGDVIGTYNKIPFVKKVNEDLPAYVTHLAVEGLFLQIAKEEALIRENPLERTSSILKKVFGYADSKDSN